MIKLRLLSVFAASLLALPACSGDDKNDSNGSSGSDSDGTDGTDSDTTATAGTDSSSGGTASGTSTTDGTATSGGSTTGVVEPQPDGASCAGPDECESGKCFLVPVLGGICGECESDADCPDGGCTIPNPLAQPPIGSSCNDGSNGGGCMSDDVCDSGVCALIIDVSGILTVSTCSECKEDAECGDGQFCQPTVDVGNLSGEKVCVDPGTKPDGEACEDWDATGDEACTNYCDPADIMGLAEVGVCGECDVATNEGCAQGETCNPPQVDLGSGVLTGASCGAGGTGGTTG